MLRKLQPKISADSIREFFYNSMAQYFLEQKDVSENNFEEKMLISIQLVILQTLEASRNSNGIFLGDVGNVTSKDAPEEYKLLLTALLNLKSDYDPLDEESCNFFRDSIRNNERSNYKVHESIVHLSLNIATLPSFQKMLPEIKSIVLNTQTKSSSHNTFFKESRITPELIRHTFYNQMLNEVLDGVNNNIIEKQDLKDQEPYLFLALPALTLIEVVYISKEVSGIKLFENQLITPENCPSEEHFKELFTPLFQMKEAITPLSKEQILALKYLCLQSELETPEDLKKLQTPEMIKIATVINELASQISRREVFKKTISLVLHESNEILYNSDHQH